MTIFAHDYTVLVKDDALPQTDTISHAIEMAGIRVKACHPDTGVIFATMSEGEADTVRDISGVETVAHGQSLHLLGGELGFYDLKPADYVLRHW